MPPALKFTKSEIIEAALNLVRKEGIAGLTARGLGAELGTSSRPIFTAFQNMEEVQKETLQAAKSVYNAYSQKGLSENPPFRGVGMQYFLFAKEEPNLFGLLFMKGNDDAVSVSDILPLTHGNYEDILHAIQESYGISQEDSYRILQTMWLFTHGLACLHVTGMIRFTEDEVMERISDVFTGVLFKLKGESPERGISQK